MDTPLANHLDWEACYNVRDLGGLPTASGATIRPRALNRSDLPAQLTDVGRRALLDYGVRTIIDLREPQQIEQEPSIFMTPTGAADEPSYLNRPLETRLPHVSRLIGKARNRAEVYCIMLDHYPTLMGNAVRAVAEARPGGVLIHCHGGKDRTGIVTGLLLSLAGVPDELIAADYALSQERLWPLWEEIVAEAGGEEKVGFWLKPTATAEMMHTMLEHLAGKHGGAEPYLRTAGVSDAQMGRLRQRLLEPA